MKKITFIWTTGTANSNMSKALNNNHISHGIDQYFNLVADLGEGPAPIDCYHIQNDVYGITYKPERTTEYFNIPADELYKMDADGWTREEKILCDHHPEAHPFKYSLYEALQEAEQLTKEGYNTKVLKRINCHYAVITE
jgi:hypothetical protein